MFGLLFIYGLVGLVLGDFFVVLLFRLLICGLLVICALVVVDLLVIC